MPNISEIEWQPTSYQGIFVNILRRDQVSGDATVLIRMEPGCEYPPHRHVGLEEVFVIQGGYRDADGVHYSGDYVINAAESVHHPVALEETACIMLAFTHRGIELIR
jgi:anti-sigma factor ChrR (cupin superfamily)